MEVVATISIAIALICALWIAIDGMQRPQRMWIMNLVWPLTALYFSAAAVWFYLKAGRRMTREAMPNVPRERMQERHKAREEQAKVSPSWQQVALADSHCGAGCALADILTESAIFAFGVTLFGSELWASYLWDFVAAWTLGVLFQYFTIQPMRDLTPRAGIWAAMKADTLSIACFQIGMYGWMAFVYFVLFPISHLHPNQASYWLMMQIGMVCGFATAFPVNRMLVRKGMKEAMG